MIARILTAALLLIGAVAFAATPQRKSKGPALKDPVPVVTEIDAGKLKELLNRGTANSRPLLINFWATWCEPCREEYPDLVKINSEFKGHGLDFITVSLDDIGDIKTAVPEFLRDMHAAMPAYLLNTPEQETAISEVDKDWTGSLPATFLLNGKGEVVYAHKGRIKPEELTAEIKRVTNGN